MNENARPGAVIFTGDKQRLAKFYEAVTGLPVRVDDDRVTVLASEHFELVIHALPGEPPGRPSAARQDGYVKPFFPVASLAEAREIAADGLLAVCIQHEMDHLMGKVFVEYLSPLKRNRIRSKMIKRQRDEARP